MLSKFWTKGIIRELSILARSHDVLYHALDGLTLIYVNIPDQLSPPL